MLKNFTLQFVFSESSDRESLCLKQYRKNRTSPFLLCMHTIQGNKFKLPASNAQATNTLDFAPSVQST